MREEVKKLILIGIGLYMAWFCQVCNASPFLVSDPCAAAIGMNFEIVEGTKTIVSQANEADGSIKYDLKDVTTGVHNYTVRYIKVDPLWGVIGESPYVPFQFTRPTIATGNITGLKLVK